MSNTYENVQFNMYIYRVLKQIHPEAGLSGDGLSSVNNFARIIIHRIMQNVNRLILNSGGKKTLSSREVQMATKLLLPGELAKHAISGGTKAVTTYHANKSLVEKRAGVKAAPVARAKRAGINFPVTRVENLMLELSTLERKSDTAAVYMAAVVEYIVAEILELAGNAARDAKKVRITPRHLKLAILNDQELTVLFKGVVMSGGVQNHINSFLVPEKKISPVTKKPRSKKSPTKKVVKKSAKKTIKNMPKKAGKKAGKTTKK